MSDDSLSLSQLISLSLYFLSLAQLQKEVIELLLVGTWHPAMVKLSQAVSKLQTFHENSSNSLLVVKYLVQINLHNAEP